MRNNIDEIFELYYSEHFDYVKRFCYYKLADYPDYADDCIQDTFRVLFEKLSENIEFKYVRAFLIKTASNFIKLKYRQINQEKNKCVSIDSNEINIPYEQSFFEHISDEMILCMKDEIISSLTEDERDLLNKTCKNYKNSYMTTKELAMEYSCSETAIRQRIFVIRRKIKAIVKEKTDNL